jgi:transketolase
MDAPEVSLADIKLSEPPAYTKGQSLATREAYGTALVIIFMILSKYIRYKSSLWPLFYLKKTYFQVKIAKNNDRVVGLDGDMKNSTFSEKLRNIYPERHVECFICEQNMAGVSLT